MEYLPTFSMNLSQMQVNLPYIWRIWVVNHGQIMAMSPSPTPKEGS